MKDKIEQLYIDAINEDLPPNVFANEVLGLFSHFKNINIDYKKIEADIIEATKEFAMSNNIHYDSLIESMILNAMRELNKRFITDGVGQSEQLCDDCGASKKETITLCKECYLKNIQD